MPLKSKLLMDINEVCQANRVINQSRYKIKNRESNNRSIKQNTTDISLSYTWSKNETSAKVFLYLKSTIDNQ